jgi:hypothetical protein
MKIFEKSVGALLGFILILSRGPGVALAQNSHFVHTPTAALTQDADDPGPADLTISFKVGGLGSTPVEDTITGSADLTVVCQCVNNSGSCPTAPNKVSKQTPLTFSGTFKSDKNGSITNSITADETECGPSSPPTCGSGQTLKLLSVDYENIQVEDSFGAGPAPTNPSSLSATFVVCK